MNNTSNQTPKPLVGLVGPADAGKDMSGAPTKPTLRQRHRHEDRLDSFLNALSHGVAVLSAMCLVAVLIVVLGIFGGRA